MAEPATALNYRMTGAGLGRLQAYTGCCRAWRRLFDEVYPLLLIYDNPIIFDTKGHGYDFGADKRVAAFATNFVA